MGAVELERLTEVRFRPTPIVGRCRQECGRKDAVVRGVVGSHRCLLELGHTGSDEFLPRCSRTAGLVGE